MSVEDAQHLLSSIRKQLLRITGVRNRLPFLRVANSQSVSYHGCNIKCIDVLEADVTQTGVGNVTDKDPSHLEDTFPLVRRPHGAAPRVVNLKQYNLSGTIHPTATTFKRTGVNISAMPQKWPLRK